jgi:hypothetical protein
VATGGERDHPALRPPKEKIGAKNERDGFGREGKFYWALSIDGPKPYLPDTGPESVTLTVAIGYVGTFELTIDRDKWDGMRALELIEQGNAVS